MKAMIFAAGLGTRLKPFTLHNPKALVEVGGKPMLQRVIERLRDEGGITSMVVNVHHFADKIKRFIAENNQFGIEIIISDESDMLLDTAGGILQARDKLMSIGNPEDSILVHNADILSDFPIDNMIEAHKSSNATATLLVQERNTSRYLLIDCKMRMRGWTNITTSEIKPSTLTDLEANKCTKYAFDGVHIISPQIFDLLQSYNKTLEGPENKYGIHKSSIMDFYINNCSTSKISAFAPENFTWHDIGKPESLEKARIWLNSAQ